MAQSVIKNIKFHYILSFIFFVILYSLFFSPVILQGKIFLVGSDHLLQNLPNFLVPKVLWTDALQGGFPVASDPQVASWYLVSHLLKWLIPNPWMAWNLFVISAYILASFFSYGYIYTITESPLAALGGGIIYGMSGFMMSHIEHTNMIHGAAWLPLSLWALEKLRHKISNLWFFLGVISICFNVLAGHPQITVYSLGLIVLYTLILGIKAPVKAIEYYQISGLLLILGVTLASVQIIPTLELSSLGTRDEVDFTFYTTFTLPPPEIVKIIFPYFFGGSYSKLYDTPYFGSWTLTETTGYVGISGLILAVVGFSCYRHKTIAQFWLVMALISLLLAFGASTPLAWLTYHLPIYNKLRGLARHFCEMSLAISVLAAMGIKSIETKTVSQGLLTKVMGVFAGLILVLLLYINLFIKPVIIANQSLDAEKILNIFNNPALTGPIIIFIATLLVTATVLFVIKKFNFKFIGILLVCLLILDLSSFGYFFAWKEQSGNYQFLTLENYPYVIKYKNILTANNQRMISLDGILGATEQIRPNLSRVWQIPNASSYNPLNLERYTKFLNADTGGTVQGSNWAENHNQSFNLMAIRHVFMKQLVPANFQERNGILWAKDDLKIDLGRECAADQNKITQVNYPLPQPVEIDAIGIVNFLGCSTDIADNTDILRIIITDIQGNIVTKTLQAGRDTSEIAYDRSDVSSVIKHSKAENIFETTADGNKYLSIVPLENSQPIKNIQLEYLADKGSISIKKISFIDREKKQSYPFNDLDSLLANELRWHHLEDINETSVYENKYVLPRMWLVPQVITLPAEEILHTIKTSYLPDNSIFDPRKVALIEDNLDFQVQEFDEQAEVKMNGNSDGTMTVNTNSKSPAFLVLSDTYYPGWQAKIDGKKTKLFVTNYLGRGLVVPQGNHLVKFEFKPLSFKLGLGLSVASIFALGYLLFVSNILKNLVNY
jgi:hypothetical protein